MSECECLVRSVHSLDIEHVNRAAEINAVGFSPCPTHRRSCRRESVVTRATNHRFNADSRGKVLRSHAQPIMASHLA